MLDDEGCPDAASSSRGLGVRQKSGARLCRPENLDAIGRVVVNVVLVYVLILKEREVVIVVVG
jgi:hypothetical protein